MGQVFREGSGSGFDADAFAGSYAVWTDIEEKGYSLIASCKEADPSVTGQPNGAILSRGKVSIRGNRTPLLAVAQFGDSPNPGAAAATLDVDNCAALAVISKSPDHAALIVNNSAQGLAAIFSRGDVLIENSLDISEIESISAKVA